MDNEEEDSENCKVIIFEKLSVLQLDVTKWEIEQIASHVLTCSLNLEWLKHNKFFLWKWNPEFDDLIMCSASCASLAGDL